MPRETDSSAVVRTTLPNARWYDYLLMYIFAFAVGAVGVWLVLIYDLGKPYGPFLLVNTAPIAPGNARHVMLAVSIGGGIIGMAALAIWMLLDRLQKTSRT